MFTDVILSHNLNYVDVSLETIIALLLMDYSQHFAFAFQPIIDWSVS